MITNLDKLIEYAEENKHWRIDNVTVGSWRHESKEFSAVYVLNTDQGTFTFPVYAKFEEDMTIDDKTKEMWKMACAVQYANLYIFSKQKEIDLSFLGKRGELFIRDMISQSVAHLDSKFPGHFTHKKHEWVESQEMKSYDYNISMNKKFAVLMSGGKESSGIYGMYHNLGKCPNEDLFGIFVDFTGKIVRRENNMMINRLREIGHNPVVISSNIIDPLMLISTKWGCNNLFINIITFEAAIYCYTKGIEYFNMGNEFDCTVCVNIDGHETFGQNYDQSTVNERKVSQYLQDLGVDVKLFSPVYNIVETACQALFTWNDNLGLQEAQNSCVEPILKNGKYIACDVCDKCWRIAAIMTALGLDCTKYGLTYREKVWDQKEDIFNSLDSTKETQTMAWLLDRKGLFPHDISKVKPKLNQVTLGMEYDKYHPIIVPQEIYNYIDNTLKQVRKDLNVEKSE